MAIAFGTRLAGILPLLLVVALFSGLANGQISPGELHKSHAFLEGMENCQKCHDPSKGISADKCMSCHAEINESLQQSSGMHGRQKLTECQICHIEHHGRNFDLIFWDKGMTKFDHLLTGYRLEGKHLTVDCRACHQAKNVVAKEYLQERKKDLARTFFGLDEKCATCHNDEHRGQLSAVCQDCHSMEAWKPAQKFEHNRAKFALVGKHLAVRCDKCHVLLADNSDLKGKGYVKYTGVKYGQCTDCHRDVHEGRLGGTCEKCHDTNNWGVTNTALFDHSRTKYPLLGKHATVTCDKCHKSGQPIKGLKYGKCLDCHSDFHKGEFTDRPSAGACEECHAVSGFVPANFAVAQHQQTKYPLQGAHLAVACNQCHSKTTPVAVKTKKQFTFASTKCQICHQDVHKGTLDKFVASDGCELCHKVESWPMVSFDHSRTKFALEGKHAAVPCRPCHGGKADSVEVAQLKFAGVSKLCEDCHKDNHRGQFDSLYAASIPGDGVSKCERCHSTANWKADRFDHTRDSGYHLEGAHRKVPCSGCHKKVIEDGVTFVRYRPLDNSCKSCHGETPVQELKKDS